MAPVTLPPGFRFHPTDEELVAYYLDRKITGRPIELDIIPDVDLYKCEPWDLPDKSYLPSKDLEWYFFSRRDRKYPNGSRTNRATTAGYWKATGKDRLVKSQKRTLGMKKTLVYYRGRAPQGIRTNWVMHEYRLLESESLLKDAYALCRIFKKISCRPKAEKKHEDDLQSAPDGYLPGNEGEDLRLPPSESGSSDVSGGSPTDHNGLIYNQYCQKWSATDEGDSSTNASPMRVEQITYPNLVESVPLSDCRKWQQHYEQPHLPLAMENFPQMETTETILHIPQMFEELLVTDKYMDHLTEENLLEEIFNVASAFNDETSDLHLQNTSYLNYSTALNESNSH